MTSQNEADKPRGGATLAETTAGFKYVFLVNIASKLVTFGANTFIVRHSSPVEQGVRLNVTLLVLSILFFTREAFRNAALRMNLGTDTPVAEARRFYQWTINTGWVSFVFTACMVVVAKLCSPHLFASGEWAEVYDTLRIPFVLDLHLLGCLLEAVGEPLYVAAQGMSLMKVRSTAEASALLSSTFTTYFFILCGFAPLDALGYAAVMYGAVHSGVFAIHFSSRMDARCTNIALGRYLPKSESGVFLPEVVTGVGGKLQLETMMRLVLTEGEKVVLSYSTVLAEQGVYEVVSHLGSTVCRLLFKFVEEFALNLWSKLVAVGAVEQSVALLQTLIRFLAILGTFFACFGPAYSRSLLFLLYGKKWVSTGAPELLAIYCVYVALMGVNGVCEAFYRAAAKDDHLSLLWKVQCLFSVVSVATSVVLTGTVGLGVAGLVLSSMIVMCLRIAFCLHFAQTFPSFKVQNAVPSWQVLLSGALSFVAVSYSEQRNFPKSSEPDWKALFIHIACGVVVCAVHIGCIAVYERHVLTALRDMFKAKKD